MRVGRHWVARKVGMVFMWCQTYVQCCKSGWRLWWIRNFHSPTDSCQNPRNLVGIWQEFWWNPAGIQEFCRNDQIPWIPGGFRLESSRNLCYFPNISTFGGTYIYVYSYLTY